MGVIDLWGVIVAPRINGSENCTRPQFQTLIQPSTINLTGILKFKPQEEALRGRMQKGRGAWRLWRRLCGSGRSQATNSASKPTENYSCPTNDEYTLNHIFFQNWSYTLGHGRIGTGRIGTRLIWLVGELTKVTFKRLSKLTHHQFMSKNKRNNSRAFVHRFPFREISIPQNLIRFVD